MHARSVPKNLRRWRQRPFLRRITLPAHTVDCPECGLRTAVPELKQGHQADCPRCGHELVRVENRPFVTPLALASAALVLLLCVYGSMFMTVSMIGVNERLTLPFMLEVLVLQDFGFLAEVMFVFTFGLPLLFLLLCLYVYAALQIKRPLPGLIAATRTMVRLREWVMADVFLISTLVAYIKLGDVVNVAFGAAFWLMFPMVLLLLRTTQAVPEHWVYYQIHRLHGHTTVYADTGGKTCCSRCRWFGPSEESHCRVCGTALFARRPGSLRLSLAFLLAAAVFYIPANTLPIMISSNPTVTEVSTIMGGILFMWDSGDRAIAAIIFSASVVIPVLKIFIMGFLLLCARYGVPWDIKKVSLLYRITEKIGRWSMIDIFVVIILMSAFHTPIARVTPGPASLYFCLVVLLTMLSVHFFDPRLLWDKYEAGETWTGTRLKLPRPSENAASTK
ncbi:PqiA/YebS family transporter subunit [Neisseria sp. WLZKY-1]|uniref:paraquat-inducible protein A n=1 Tax=Neisseria sp. WLZKY-1 TaxID=3390377 RepID=UPI00397BE6D5